MTPSTGTHYDLLGLDPDCSFDDIRAAYRRTARLVHPDVANRQDQGATMAEVNEAWRVLSNAELRRDYDATVAFARSLAAKSEPLGSDMSKPFARDEAKNRPRSAGDRRQAWAAGVQAQMARLARQAGRSSIQTALLKSRRGSRSDYEEVLDDLVTKLSSDVENRVRSARAAGAAPLDLGVAATLVGVRVVADGLRRQGSLGVNRELMMSAELLDRMWDVLAHELPLTLTVSLGGNPHVVRALAGLS